MFELAPGTRYRYEPALDDGICLLYNVETEQFRVTDEEAYRIVRGVEDGEPVDRIAAETDLPSNEVQEFCADCVDLGFLARETLNSQPAERGD